MRTSLIAVAGLGLVLSSCACEREESTKELEPEKKASTEEAMPKELPDGGTELGSPKPEMAQNFEGRTRLVLKRPEGQVDIAFLSKGQRSRLQVEDSKRPERRLDLIFDDDRGAVLLNDRKQYFDVELDKLEEKPEAKSEVQQVTSTEDTRKVVHGLNCNMKELTQPGQKISACVLGVPGEIDADEFEALTGIDLPPWVEYLFERDLWPVTATVRDDSGKVLYTLEVLDYTSRPLPEAQELGIPPNFTRIEPRVPVLR
jgi:hypothetical protein